MFTFAPYRNHLHEASITGIIDKYKPFVLFYGRGRGAQIMALSNNGKYDVQVYKMNSSVGSNLLAGAVGSVDKTFDWIGDIATQEGILKSKTKGLSPKDFKTYMIQKLGVSIGVMDRVYPELNDPTVTAGKEIAGMTVVGIDAFKNTDVVERFIKKGASMLKSHGFSRLLYGEIYLISAGGMAGKTLADYSPEADKIRIKVKERDENDMMKTFLHEMGHREYFKFGVDKKAIYEKYWEVRGKKPVYKPGTVFIDKKTYKSVEITDVKLSSGRVSYTGYYTDDKSKSQPLNIPSGAIEPKSILQGTAPDLHPFHVSEYALTNEREFFAEVFSFAMMKNDSVLLKWIKSVTK